MHSHRSSATALAAARWLALTAAAPFVTAGCGGDSSLGTAAASVSCAALKQASPMSTDGSYLIDPDGEGGAAPFMVWCDMTFDGGGWTALPLRFADPALWSIRQTGATCTTVPAVTMSGSLLSFKNTPIMPNLWSYLSIKFVPPIAVQQVRLVNLAHSTATACNDMDLLYTVTPASTGDDTAESWYFAGEDPTAPLGYTFADGCSAPGYASAGVMPPECKMTLGDATAQITRQIKLSAKAPHFNMVAVEGCGSNPPCNLGTGQSERFSINHPAAGGLWKDGILVR